MLPSKKTLTLIHAKKSCPSLIYNPNTIYIRPTPPRATPPATVQPPLHGQPSTVYCSSSPPHHGLLFIQPQPARSIGVLFIQRQHHGVLFIHPHRELFIHPPQRSLFIQRQHRSTSVSSSSEGITRLGLVNNHRSIARFSNA